MISSLNYKYRWVKEKLEEKENEIIPEILSIKLYASQTDCTGQQQVKFLRVLEEEITCQI